MSKFKYSPLPSSPCKWDWSNSTRRIYQALGVSGTKVPATLHGRFKVDGWNIVVKRGTKGGARKTATHRIFVDHGGRLIPAGRLRQAACPITKLRAKRRLAKRRR
jgi:hypothetical protein